MKQVAKDGEFIIIQVPTDDLDSLVRFIAHRINDNPDKVLKLAHTIVNGDLTKQDEVVKEFAETIDVIDWSLVLKMKDALNLCDDLADAIYDEIPVHMATEPSKPVNHLRLVKICVECHKGYIKGTRHLCERDLV